MRNKPLGGQVLADAYAAALTTKFTRDIGQHPGKIWAYPLGGGWIEVRGESLKAHPDLAGTYPNGWCMLDRSRYGYCRSFVAKHERGVK